MASTQKPIIFLAFANPLNDLDQGREVKDLTAIFKLKGLKDRFDPKIEFGVTLEDIRKIFNEYEDQICIFHYSGHANATHLLLQDKLDSGATLGSFLAKQGGLELVILNACETQSLGKHIAERGIPLVVATPKPVKDKDAIQFSRNFFTNLSDNFTVKEAFENTISTLNKDRDDKSILRSCLVTKDEDAEGNDFLLLFKDKDNLGWTLKHPLNDPYFGLPKPDFTYSKLPDKPFIGLKQYGTTKGSDGITIIEDTTPLFFGRADMIRELFEAINIKKDDDGESVPNVILLYGKSGMGKSSLLAAGLEPRLKKKGISSLYRRRTSEGLVKTLANTLDVEVRGDHPLIGWKEIQNAWVRHEKKNNQPLIIILDQVEEAITENKAEEIENLADIIKYLFGIKNESTGKRETPILGRLILSYRKEFHAEIESTINGKGIDFRWVFLEPLLTENIKEVVEGIPNDKELIKKYPLEVEPKVTESIETELRKKNKDAISPVLQLLLTNMWANTQPDNRNFSLDILDELLKKGVWLEDFVNQQLEKVKENFSKEVESGLVLDLLHYLTTELGTAKTETLQALQARYDTDPDTITALLKKLDELYLVARTDNGADAYRLSHDTLAPIVRKMYADSTLHGQAASRLLVGKGKDTDWGKNPFGERDLEILTKGRSGMPKWDESTEKAYLESKNYIEEGRRKVEEKELQLEDERKQREEGLRQLGSARKKTIFWLSGLAVSILVIIVIIGINIQTTKNQFLVDQLVKLAEVTNDNTLAVQASYKSWELFPNDQKIVDLLQNKLEYPIYQNEIFTSISLGSLAISHNGKFIAVSSDKLVKIYDLQNLSPVKTLSQLSANIKIMYFSPNGKYLAIAFMNNTIQVWDYENEKLLGKYFDFQVVISSLAFSPDEQSIIIGSKNEVKIWKWNDKKPPIELFGNQDIISSVTFSPDGQSVASGSLDGTINIWNGKELPIVLSGFKDKISSVVFSPDSRLIASGSTDGIIRIWNLSNGEAIKSISRKFTEEAILCLDFSKDGHSITAGDKEGVFNIWDWKSGMLLRELRSNQSSVRGVALSSHGEHMAKGNKDGTIVLWNGSSEELFHKLPGAKGIIRSVAFSPNGQFVASGGLDGIVRVQDWKRNKPPIQLSNQADNDSIYCVAFSKDGQLIASGGKNGVVNIWDWRNEKKRDTLVGHKGTIRDLAFSSDIEGKYLASASYDGTVRIWNRKNKGFPRIYTWGSDSIYTVKFSPRGDFIAAGSSNGIIKVWNLNDKIQSYQLPGYKGSVYSLSFSPDGETIVSGDKHGVISKWQWNKEKLIDTLVGHENSIFSVALSSDGRSIFSGGLDKKVIMWGQEDVTVYHTIRSMDSPVYSVSVSPDGSFIALGGGLYISKNISYGTLGILRRFDSYLKNPDNIAPTSLAKFFTNGITAYELQEVLVYSKANCNDLNRLIQYFNNEDRRNQGYHLNWCYEKLINLTTVESERKYLSEQKSKIEDELKKNPPPLYLTLWWQIQRVWYTVVLFFEG